MLRKMVSEKCEYVVIEVSSHAMDQNRLWGVNIDTAVLTNIYDNEHLDYHGTFVDYLKSKEKLFKNLNYAGRKPNVKKQMILNRDSEHFDNFADFTADKTWTFAKRNQADVRAEDAEFSAKNISFDIRVPNNNAHIDVSIVGNHNLENVLCAIAVAMSSEVPMSKIAESLKVLPGIPGRLESIDLGQPFSVIVDFSYKPSALKAVFNSMEDLTDGRIIAIWGGAGGRHIENWQDSAKIIDEYADEFILTTDDPGMTDPKEIAKIIRAEISREEADDFFEIEDRYEAIRYAIYTAQADDTVLIAGRGHEQIQTIGKKKIKFDDREVAREILKFTAEHKLED
jgi:UDP-N-acetylmuramoyl-L-alanyl-D-glutamate--2,6-diaminopimelate ligase